MPRQIPDERFAALFAAPGSHRDRALVALWVSSGARAAELLGVSCGDIDPGRQLITVIRKGSRALQQLPASSDAFVWLRLYQQQMQGLVCCGRDQPLWWTLRRPLRQLTYHAAYRMFARGPPPKFHGTRDILARAARASRGQRSGSARQVALLSFPWVV